MALSGDSTALGDAIRKANNIVANPVIPDQAHHLLASSIVLEYDAAFATGANKNKKLADAAGYELNGAPNGVLMPTHFGHQRKMNVPRHRGYHWAEYFDHIRDLLDPIYQKFALKDVCNEPEKTNFKLELKGAESTTKKNLVGPPPVWWLNSWSEPLWTGDYRDEGTGTLVDITRVPDTSRNAGLDWLAQTKIPGAIKRRCLTQPLAAPGAPPVYVLNALWYSVHQYPPPPDIYT